jgi:hypothetical protein
MSRWAFDSSHVLPRNFVPKQFLQTILLHYMRIRGLAIRWVPEYKADILSYIDSVRFCIRDSNKFVVSWLQDISQQIHTQPKLKPIEDLLTARLPLLRKLALPSFFDRRSYWLIVKNSLGNLGNGSFKDILPFGVWVLILEQINVR